MGSQSPWREPMVWLMIGLPAASVVAGIGLLLVALRSGGADTVRDEVQRTAQVQVSELGPDARAQAMKLSAVLRLEDSSLEVLPVSGEFARSEGLILTLSHPADAAQDRELILQPTELGWRAGTDARASHDWIAELVPIDRQWRIRGRLKAGERATRMGAALRAD